MFMIYVTVLSKLRPLLEFWSPGGRIWGKRSPRKKEGCISVSLPAAGVQQLPRLWAAMQPDWICLTPLWRCGCLKKRLLARSSPRSSTHSMRTSSICPAINFRPMWWVWQDGGAAGAFGKLYPKLEQNIDFLLRPAFQIRSSLGSFIYIYFYLTESMTVASWCYQGEQDGIWGPYFSALNNCMHPISPYYLASLCVLTISEDSVQSFSFVSLLKIGGKLCFCCLEDAVYNPNFEGRGYHKTKHILGVGCPRPVI